MSAISGGTIILMGVGWLSQQITTLGLGQKTVYVQAITAAVLIALVGWFLYYLVYVKTKTGDFLIATEGEMKKVNWSTKREIIGSTWVVIGLTLFIAVIIAILDYLFTLVFLWCNVLEG